MAAMHGIEIASDTIESFCVRNGVRKLALFGSILRDDFRPDSDIDVLIEFEEGRVPGLFGFMRMERELSDLFGRKADLRTPEDLSRYFRDQVIAGAHVQYERVR
jgi:predicted nucleotidyltransferase